TPPGQAWPPVLYTYLLYPRPVISDWRRTAYLKTAEVPDDDSFLVEARDRPATYLAVYPHDTEGQPLPAGTALVTAPMVLGLSSPSGNEAADGATYTLVGSQPAKLTLGSPRAGQALLTFQARPGPGLPERTARPLRVTGPGGYAWEEMISTNRTVTLNI